MAQAPVVQAPGDANPAVRPAADVELPVPGPKELTEVGMAGCPECYVRRIIETGLPSSALQKERTLGECQMLHLRFGSPAAGEMNHLLNVGWQQDSHASRVTKWNCRSCAGMVECAPAAQQPRTLIKKE